MPNKPEDKEQPEKIDVEYEYDPDYRLVAANGLFGGVTPRGELRIDFFAEYVPAPGAGCTAGGKVLFNKDLRARRIPWPDRNQFRATTSVPLLF